MTPATKLVRSNLEKNKLDALFLSSPANISYLTDSPSRDSYLLISKKESIYLTDSRYLQAAKETLRERFSIEKIDRSCYQTLQALCSRLSIKRLGFEEKHLSYYSYRRITSSLEGKAKLLPSGGVVEGSREIKSAKELNKIRHASRITKEALKFARRILTPGKTELEIAADLERFIKYKGASDSAFKLIVASGSNSSYPHHLTSKRKIKKNDLVLIDIGVDYLGYKSDLTRVFFLGKINPLVHNVFDIVKEAQTQAIKKVKPGIPIRDIDLASRRRLSEFGYGEYFIHNTGHGIGLEVHEAPNISSKESKLIKAGMVFTIEPGVYLPGKFGIRIEDLILVTKKGAVLL